MYRIQDYDYTLPPDRIAQEPAPERDRSRLMVLNRMTGTVSHHQFLDLPDLLDSGDLLVMNNTEVVPARLVGQKKTGGRVELLILDLPERIEDSPSGNALIFQCLVKSAKPLRPESVIAFDENLKGRVLEGGNGIYIIQFLPQNGWMDILYRIGQVPLPPYIRRESGIPTKDDARSYQTVYASRKGAVAAPTAGLHFTPRLFRRLREKGIRTVEITLHVGYGTFLPVRCNDIRGHQMHPESFIVLEEAAETIQRSKAAGSRIVAVGTTCVRTLEFVADATGTMKAVRGRCNLFIYPGFRFKMVDALVTNFHLPQSTLLMLVSAFAGRERTLNAYREATRMGYRFYSFGDAMLIL